VGVVRGGRQAVDADQVIFRLAAGQALVKELGHGNTLRRLDVVGKAAAVVVDEQ
jgi:hypothetical protein